MQACPQVTWFMSKYHVNFWTLWVHYVNNKLLWLALPFNSIIPLHQMFVCDGLLGLVVLYLCMYFVTLIYNLSYFFRSKKVSFYGTEYRVGSVIQVGWRNGLPEFASILKITTISSRTYFIFTSLVTLEFSKHFHAFITQRTTNNASMISTQTDFFMYLPTHTINTSNTVNSSLYIVTRHKPQVKK